MAVTQHKHHTIHTITNTDKAAAVGCLEADNMNKLHLTNLPVLDSPDTSIEQHQSGAVMCYRDPSYLADHLSQDRILQIPRKGSQKTEKQSKYNEEDEFPPQGTVRPAKNKAYQTPTSSLEHLKKIYSRKTTHNIN